MVHAVEIAGCVAQDGRTPLVVQLQGRSDIQVRLGIAHHGRIDKQRFLIRRLAVFHINQARDALQAVDDRRSTLGNLDAFQPLARNIGQAEGGSDAPHHRPVLIQHLGVDAAQSEQTDLTGAGHGIAVAHRHAGRIFKTFRQIAAGHLAQSGSRNNFGSQV